MGTCPKCEKGVLTVRAFDVQLIDEDGGSLPPKKRISSVRIKFPIILPRMDRCASISRLARRI